MFKKKGPKVEKYIISVEWDNLPDSPVTQHTISINRCIINKITPIYWNIYEINMKSNEIPFFF